MAPAVIICCLLTISCCLTTAIVAGGSCANPDLCCSGLNDGCHRWDCYCDVACLRYKDCCPDFRSTCLTVNNSTSDSKPSSTLPLTGSCSHPALCCTGFNYSCFSGCFCDEACVEHSDCCPDYNSTCIFSSTSAPPPITSTAAPPKVVTVLEVKVKMMLPEEDHQAALLKVGAVLESLLKGNNTEIYSFKVMQIKQVSP
ncbi:poly(U)-specific endoribonuclease-like isoform X2 [Puntigrus tetrazona]|uniref:poly(U)-specific endoribonuclease-like isoform X2 n=1 Tax=Puntigrus tetrazona TaxID=1606681 RepID=UPI001C8AB048|nr:poly(U)-specific endoribonuclease-like isoform X2 [Puntigrus tetrazona]